MPLYARILWITVPPGEAAAAVVKHREHVRELRERGTIRHAGAFSDDEGFLEIFVAKDLHEATAVVQASPLVEAGQCSWQLREWNEIQDR
ncbi:MAG: hypothetical protein R3344_11770 [Acidobacteriota bacterium]|nr:hypothetical protein [Acidobacteriota bacterium]